MKATRTVYCYYFPEIRKIIDELTEKFPHEVFLRSIEPGLDNFHFPIIEKFIEYSNNQLPFLKEFKYRYFTAGASEGIFHLLVNLKTKNPETILYVLSGEYEGYKEYAARIGLQVKEIEENEPFSKLKKGVWFISNPSARDGNIIKNDIINNICKYHQVILDATYVGLTKEYEFDLKNPNILAVIVSMSKPFGLYYYRAGFTFSREKIETLEANIWFKNIFSLLIADKIFDNIKPGELYNKYRKIQEKIIDKVNKEENLNLEASDVLLLAWTKEENTGLEKYKRAHFYRACLTPYFLDQEKEKKCGEKK
ncbi:hypothetical protein A3K73_08050 [Candidatus Pacearchaeota archaeon RBG_13_36_9]|nr:MAG: hypothetical protein A3K73_08050 [Candidatus Pacearchaeota archaeon RBG_13_36_9]